MDNQNTGVMEREFHEITGAIDAIKALKDELKLRLDEARDDCVREVIDNVVALVDAHSIEYQLRRSRLRKKLRLENLNDSGM